MALVVEDGTGKSDADAYVSQADADTYHSDRNNTAWASLTSAAKDAAIRYATVTLDGLYEWSGELTSTTQALDWPRSGAEDDEGRTFDDDEIPDAIPDATCELALLSSSTALNSSYDRGGAVKSERVGPLAIEYFNGAAIEPYLPILDRIIAGLGTRRSLLARDLERA